MPQCKNLSKQAQIALAYLRRVGQFSNRTLIIGGSDKYLSAIATELRHKINQESKHVALTKFTTSDGEIGYALVRGIGFSKERSDRLLDYVAANHAGKWYKQALGSVMVGLA